MRIVIDMQGAQSESKFRGIGRYTMSFVHAVLRNRGEHEIILALNGLFPHTIEPIRSAFDDLLPQKNIRVWYAPGPVRESEPENENRREVAELIREAFIASLRPDVVHISSLFEGYLDDAVISIGKFDKHTPVCVSFYDLIPLLNSDHYLKPYPIYARYYQRRIDYLKLSVGFLAISEFTRQECIAHLGVPESRVTNVSAAVEPQFKVLQSNDVFTSQLCQKFRITRPFVFYTGGSDERKNLPRLIHAYASLPLSLRQNHQLLIAGKISNRDIEKLKRQAKLAGLSSDELCFTGYLSDEELVQLYNICTLFIFPSWYEGFGLPALEAMACGAPVIGSNCTSIPEVIGREDALFDPFSVESIKKAMQWILSDEKHRQSLINHGLKQVKLFSWDETSRKAIKMWERLIKPKAKNYLDCTLAEKRLYELIALHASGLNEAEIVRLSASLAQNQQTGIERQLFIDITDLSQYNISTAIQQQVRMYLKLLLQYPPRDFRVEPVYAATGKGYCYARCFTNSLIGNSDAGITDDSILWQRGDIFFVLSMQQNVQLAQRAFYRQLHHDGVIIKFFIHDLIDLQRSNIYRDVNVNELHDQWLNMVAENDGAICITRTIADVYKQWIKETAVLPQPTFQITWVHDIKDIEGLTLSGYWPSDVTDFFNVISKRPCFMSFVMFELHEELQQIIDSIERLWGKGFDFNFVLVGKKVKGNKMLFNRINNHPEHSKRLFLMEVISDECVEQLYMTSIYYFDANINKEFDPLLIEATSQGIPIIDRYIPKFCEMEGNYFLYFAGDTVAYLAGTLRNWLAFCNECKHEKSDYQNCLIWKESAEKLKDTLIGHNNPQRQLLVDISELVKRDAKSGIQRVVKNILKEWLINPPSGWRVEPVYAAIDQPYRYARRFTAQFLNIAEDNSMDNINDEPIDYAPGDVFFCLDFDFIVQTVKADFYQRLRRHGVRVEFIVYDLLCILQPQYFVADIVKRFSTWLDVVCESDGAVCISKAVADEMLVWVEKNGPKRYRPFKIQWFHLGADISNSVSSKGLPSDAEKVLDLLRRRSSFLMVGTLEPRKGHAQVLDAFEYLWREGKDINLVIVGNKGWMMNTFIKRLYTHPELNRHLIWLEGTSDEYLEKIYAVSTCLIAASFGEGFGLPLIEASQHNIPIIARDIPVFREVAGEHAFYFEDTNDPITLVEKIKEWLDLYKQGIHPKSDDIPYLTWEDSAKMLMDKIKENL